MGKIHQMAVNYISSKVALGRVYLRNIFSYEQPYTYDDLNLDDLVTKRILDQKTGDVAGVKLEIPVVTGDAMPVFVDFATYPQFGPDTIFQYYIKNGTDYDSNQNFTAKEKYSGSDFIGFDLYGYDDGTGHFLYDGKFKVVSAPGAAPIEVVAGGGTDFPSQANTWLEDQTFNKKTIYNKGGFNVRVYPALPDADRDINYPNDDGVIALTKNVATQKVLTGTSDGVTGLITIAHGLGFTPTSFICQPLNHEALIARCYGDATNVNIKYYGTIPPAGTVTFSGSFK